MKATWKDEVVAESADTVVVGSDENADAAWFYPDPKEAAADPPRLRSFAVILE